MKTLKKVRIQENLEEQRVAYEAPAIIYETVITTRAGSPLGIDGQSPDGVDPADLFGNN